MHKASKCVCLFTVNSVLGTQIKMFCGLATSPQKSHLRAEHCSRLLSVPTYEVMQTSGCEVPEG